MILNEIEIKYREYANEAIDLLNRCKSLNIPLNGVIQEQTVEIAVEILQSTIRYDFADESDLEVVRIKQECANYLSQIAEIKGSLPK